MNSLDLEFEIWFDKTNVDPYATNSGRKAKIKREWLINQIQADPYNPGIPREEIERILDHPRSIFDECVREAKEEVRRWENSDVHRK